MPRSSDEAYLLLRQRLISGLYAPGAPLREEALAKELSLSRTPVRAALKKLVDDGLATFEFGRGVRVSSWTEADMLDTYQVRSVLEAHAAERAAQRCTPALRERLGDLNRRMQDALGQATAESRESLQRINSEFHHAVLDAAASPRLQAALNGIIDMPIYIRSFFISTPADIAQSLSHHCDIATAISAGDADLARQAMQLHLRIAINRFKQRRAEYLQHNRQTGDPNP